MNSGEEVYTPLDRNTVCNAMHRMESNQNHRALVLYTKVTMTRKCRSVKRGKSKGSLENTQIAS